MRVLLISALVLTVMMSEPCSSQVLFTGQSAGKNNGYIYLFGTGQEVNGIHSANNWAAAVLGISKHFDLVLGGGAELHLPQSDTQENFRSTSGENRGRGENAKIRFPV